jgi:GDP-L-fucose synthase
VTIRELAEIIAAVAGHDIEILFDPGKPDGTPRKLLDSNRLKVLGWRPRIPLEEGIAQTYRWLLQNIADARGWNEEAKYAADVRR